MKETIERAFVGAKALRHEGGTLSRLYGMQEQSFLSAVQNMKKMAKYRWLKANSPLLSIFR